MREFLKGPYLWDENHYWETSLIFSESLIPSLNELKNYQELSTPLPFIIFGILQHLFQQGIFLGRLFTFILSLAIAFIIGWGKNNQHHRSVLCLIGLFLCPYYLFYSGLLYTDIIASFFVLLGVMSYVHNRHFLSSIAFILAISSRQYTLAFPMAIAVYEFTIMLVLHLRSHKISLTQHWKWIAYVVACISIFGWIFLFQGLAPEVAIEASITPEVQKTVWAITPGGAINFLAFAGLHIVIPEFILFKLFSKFQISRQQKYRIIIVASVLLAYVLIFPPLLFGLGITSGIVDLLPSNFLKFAFLYFLSLIACIRFSQPKLISLMLLFNSFIAIKAHPWDKYILPMLVVFWYLKSIGFEEEVEKKNMLLSKPDSN